MSETCELTGTVLDASLLPFEGALLYATPLTINDELIYSGAKRARSESDGSIEFDLIQGGRYNLRGNALGFEGEGINVTIPESASALLKSLLAVSQIPEEGLTVKANGSAFANLQGTLDFSSRFALTESPASEINIELAASGVAAGVYTSANITVDSYGRVTAAANGAGGGGVWGSIGGDIADQADLIALVGTQLTQAEADALYEPLGGGGTPGGSDTQIQFNDGGAFGGDAGLTYNKTTNVLIITDGGITNPVATDTEAFGAILAHNSKAKSVLIGKLAFLGNNGSTGNRVVIGYDAGDFGDDTVIIGSGGRGSGSGVTGVGKGVDVTTEGTALGFQCQAKALATLSGGYASRANGSGGNIISFGDNTWSQGTSTRNILLGSGMTVDSVNDVMVMGFGSDTSHSATSISGLAAGDFLMGLVGTGGAGITNLWIGKGRSHATPSAIAIQPTAGVGTDITGANISILGGVSTGTGEGGNVLIGTTPTGSTGATPNAYGTVALAITGTSTLGLVNASNNAIAIHNSYTSRAVRNYLQISTFGGTATIGFNGIGGATASGNIVINPKLSTSDSEWIFDVVNAGGSNATFRPGNDNTQQIGTSSQKVKNINLGSGGVVINGTRVLTAQQAAIADATDAATAISQLNLLLAAARTHGLIAT